MLPSEKLLFLTRDSALVGLPDFLAVEFCTAELESELKKELESMVNVGEVERACLLDKLEMGMLWSRAFGQKGPSNDNLLLWVMFGIDSILRVSWAVISRATFTLIFRLEKRSEIL